MNAQYQFQNILLIDDDEISSIVSGAILREAKLASNIHMLFNGKQAVDFLTKRSLQDIEAVSNPMLVFLDLNMPVMDGFEFLEEFYSNEKFRPVNLKIVVLTSSAHPRDKEKAEKYPIAGFVTKPLTPNKIKAILE